MQAHAAHLAAASTRQQLHSAQLISESLRALSASLTEQAPSVRFVSSAAEASLGNVRSGNRELAEAVARPSSLRNAALALLLSLWALLLLLDFYN